MFRVKFALAAVLGLVVTLTSSDVFGQDCCCDNGGRFNRVRVISRIRTNRSAYTNNCCPAPVQATCCPAPAPVACCATPAPCCQTACCSQPACGHCHTACATNNCGSCDNCGRTGIVRRLGNRNDCYTSHVADCGCSSCGMVSTGCSSCGTVSTGCAGCATGGLIQGTSEGVVAPVMPAPEAPAPTPAPEATKATSSDT